MNANYTADMLEMEKSLETLAIKGTTSTINTRVKLISEEKNIEKVKADYDEIINELISEREKAVRIAQTYKAEIDRIEISDENVKHLNSTVESILEIVRVIAPNTPVEIFEQVKELISVDTLKALQLLGFNYKAAIGEPLTQLCANTILSKLKTGDNKAKRL